jgi:hypothetical protein
MRSTANRVEITGDRTPFLAERIIGRRAWRVEIRGVPLQFPQGKDPHVRTFVVFLDANSGELLRISSTTENGPTLKERPSAALAEQQLRGSGEIYVSLLSQAPGIGFVDALGTVIRYGFASSLQAQEIDAVYVLESERNRPGRPVWVIELHGIPPFNPPQPKPLNGAPPPQIPIEQRDHMRYVVDANDGALMFSTNNPQSNPN